MNFKRKRPVKQGRACGMCKYYKYLGNGKHRKPIRDRRVQQT